MKVTRRGDGATLWSSDSGGRGVLVAGTTPPDVIEDQSVTLAAGDAVVFPGDVVHTYANPHTRPARFSLAVFEPGVGAGPRADGVDG